MNSFLHSPLSHFHINHKEPNMNINRKFPLLGMAVFNLVTFILSIHVLSQMSRDTFELNLHGPWIMLLLLSAVNVLVMARDLKSIK